MGGRLAPWGLWRDAASQPFTVGTLETLIQRLPLYCLRPKEPRLLRWPRDANGEVLGLAESHGKMGRLRMQADGILKY